MTHPDIVYHTASGTDRKTGGKPLLHVDATHLRLAEL